MEELTLGIGTRLQHTQFGPEKQGGWGGLLPISFHLFITVLAYIKRQ